MNYWGSVPDFANLNIKVNAVKSTVLATAILFSLAAPVSILAEPPAVTEALPEAAVATTEVIELQVAPEKPAEAVAPATIRVEEPAAAEAPGSDVRRCRSRSSLGNNYRRC